jgi:parvulin-like peptidyl-prolyl isomerase
MFNLKRVFILMLFFTLTACSAGSPNSPVVSPSPTLAAQTSTPLSPTVTSVPMALTVNSEGISVEEFNAELDRYKQAQKALGNVVSDDQALQTVRDDLISQFLLAQGAVEAGFSMDAAALQQRKDALIAKVGADKFNAWLQEHGYSADGFDQALKRAAAAAWMRDKIMASVPITAEQIHVRQILLYNEDVAKSYYNQLQAGADFDELAAQVDPVARGDIGWFPRGYLTEKAVEDAAFALEIGAYSAIIPGEAGFHILKLLDRQSERGLSPDALFAMQNRALSDWLTARRQQSSIVMVP